MWTSAKREGNVVDVMKSRVSRIAAIAAVAWMCVANIASAQSGAAQETHPTFEVATLKRSASPLLMSTVPDRSGDRFTFHGAPLLLMVAYAYNVPFFAH